MKKSPAARQTPRHAAPARAANGSETRSKPAATRRAPRAAAAGDVAPARSGAGVEAYVVQQATEAANAHEVAAITDILKGEAPADRAALVQQLLKAETPPSTPTTNWRPTGAKAAIRTRT
jgi:hypothetical protein